MPRGDARHTAGMLSELRGWFAAGFKTHGIKRAAALLKRLVPG
jgi:hypothetical protein